MTLEKLINQQIANFHVFYTKLHHFHWYIKGQNFFTLHEKFEVLYSETAENLDEWAERLLAIGGKPISTLKAALDAAEITETDASLSEEEMVQNTIQDLQLLKNNAEKIAKLAEENNDLVTHDMAVDNMAQYDKHIWMLRAFLNK